MPLRCEEPLHLSSSCKANVFQSFLQETVALLPIGDHTLLPTWSSMKASGKRHSILSGCFEAPCLS